MTRWMRISSVERKGKKTDVTSVADNVITLALNLKARVMIVLAAGLSFSLLDL